ncbi:thiamine pyrophosphate-dependent enzyme [Nanoarchaeota archaeon]
MTVLYKMYQKIINSGKNVNELYLECNSEQEFLKIKEQLKKELIEFEDSIVKMWENAEIAAPVHFSGGNEEQLIEIFKEIKKGDYILGTHRAHYQYLLAGGKAEDLKRMICEGDSMHIFDKQLNFITSAIVGGTSAISAGLAFSLKRKNSNKKVWCFVGDGVEDEGHFYEAVRYVDGWDLPCTFVIEDNNRSVDTQKYERYGKSEMPWPRCVKRYFYNATYPHVGTDKWVNFGSVKAGGLSF